MTIECSKNHPETTTSRRSLIPQRSRGAIILLTALVAVPAFAVPASATSGVPPYQYFESHVARHDDCVDAKATAASGPAYRVYDSHVAWRHDEVPPPAMRSAGPEWELFNSHVARNDVCSLHPIVMSQSVPSYSWSDVVRFFSGS